MNLRTEDEMYSLCYDWLALIVWYSSVDYNNFFIINLLINLRHDNYNLFSKNTLGTECNNTCYAN